MEQFRAAMEALKAALVKMVRQILDFWQRNKHHLQPLITAQRGRVAKEEWKSASRTARILSRHPDLAPMDGYLDVWYPGVLRT